MSSKTSIDIAVKKMLNALGLRITKQCISRRIYLVSESVPGTVRQFKDYNGIMLTIHISSHNFNDFAGVFPSGGSWTYFKNDNQATFDLFTKHMREYVIRHNTVVNPFFGCYSPEEVIVKCDLMTE